MEQEGVNPSSSKLGPVPHSHAHLYAPCGDRPRIRQLLAIQGNVCAHCGKPMRLDRNGRCAKAATIDHVFPRAKGGKNQRNQVLMHRACNAAKGVRPPTEAERAFLAALNARLTCPSAQKA